MNQKTVKVKILGKTKEYPYGISYGEIVEEYQESSRYPIVLVMKDGKLCELHKKLKRDGVLEFVTTGDEIGHKTSFIFYCQCFKKTDALKVFFIKEKSGRIFMKCFP